MSSFSRFQDINQKRGIANQQTDTRFIMKGYPSILIKSVDTDEELAACVVNHQEKDSAYIYTRKESPIEVGSVWGAKGLKWLISEEIIIIKDVNWHKYAALLCNVEVNGLWGYFISPERKHVAVSLRDEVLLQSQQKPILVLGADALGIGDKFIIKDRAWMVQEKDNLAGVVYYSLVATTINKGEDYQVEVDTRVAPQIVEDDDPLTFTPGQEVVVNTEGGVFKVNCSSVEVISRTANEVVFIVPFGVDEVEVTTLLDGELITETYRKEF